jgi:hypothetical protein
MSGTDRFPELTACNAAKKAVDDFDAAHASKAEAIKLIAKMLERGGWGAIAFDEEFRHIPEAQRIEPDIAPPSAEALRGDSIENIVTQRRLLYQAWDRAFQNVPGPIRGSAPSPHQAGLTRLPGRQPRR